ncbi:Peroxin-3-domain-containing protein [Mycena vitilis]|nr:Peroxin-3-domain-containing protein [Mycena vitilis]
MLRSELEEQQMLSLTAASSPDLSSPWPPHSAVFANGEGAEPGEEVRIRLAGLLPGLARWSSLALNGLPNELIDERVAKENLKRRFTQTQSDISYTILMLIPALAEQVLREMDLDAITQELQAHSHGSRLASSALSASVELVHAPQGEGSRERSQDTRSEVSDASASFSGASSQSWVEAGGSGAGPSGSREMILGESVAPVQLSDSLMTTTSTDTDSSSNSAVDSTSGSELPSRPSRAELWNELKMLTFTRTLTTVYTVTLLTLLTTVQLTLLARGRYVRSVVQLEKQQRRQPLVPDLSMLLGMGLGFGGGLDALLGDDAEEEGDFAAGFGWPEHDAEGAEGEEEVVAAKYLTMTWWILHVGWKDVGERVRRGVEEVFNGVSLKTKLAPSDLHRLVHDVRRRVEHEVTFEGTERKVNFYTTLLPQTPETTQHVLTQGGYASTSSASISHPSHPAVDEGDPFSGATTDDERGRVPADAEAAESPECASGGGGGFGFVRTGTTSRSKPPGLQFRTPRSRSGPPQLAVNGVSAAMPKRFRTPGPGPSSSGLHSTQSTSHSRTGSHSRTHSRTHSSASISAAASESELRKRDLAEQLQLHVAPVTYPAMTPSIGKKGSLNSPLIPLSPDPFGRHPSQGPPMRGVGAGGGAGSNGMGMDKRTSGAYWEAPVVVPAPTAAKVQRNSAGSISISGRTTATGSSSRFSTDSVKGSSADGAAKQSNRTTLMSVKGIKKLWRKSNKNSVSGISTVRGGAPMESVNENAYSPLSPPLPVPGPPQRPNRPSTEDMDLPDVDVEVEVAVGANGIGSALETGAYTRGRDRASAARWTRFWLYAARDLAPCALLSWHPLQAWKRDTILNSVMRQGGFPRCWRATRMELLRQDPDRQYICFRLFSQNAIDPSSALSTPL